MQHDALRKAVEAGDLEATLACMSPSVVFPSPVTFKPFEGRDAVGVLFGILFKTFEDFRYVGEYTAEDGSGVLHFLTRVAALERLECNGGVEHHRRGHAGERRLQVPG